jgi:hypothetical protein
LATPVLEEKTHQFPALVVLPITQDSLTNPKTHTSKLAERWVFFLQNINNTIPCQNCKQKKLF